MVQPGVRVEPVVGRVRRRDVVPVPPVRQIGAEVEAARLEVIWVPARPSVVVLEGRALRDSACHRVIRSLVEKPSDVGQRHRGSALIAMHLGP